MERTDPAVQLERFTIPADYDGIFRQRILIITGVGRSGTTILGKVIGSLRPTFYLFEPALMQLIPFLNACAESSERVYSLLLQSLLFEDYFLQVIHGRSLNFNVQDDSYIGNYVLQSDIERRWKNLARRGDVLVYLKNEHPLFVIKTPEFQPLCSVAQQAFSQPRFIHIIRDGSDVVSSTVNRGWYTDEYMNTVMIDWVEKRGDKQNCNIPWYLDSESKEHFPRWNQTTRATSIWRSLTESGMAFCAENPDHCFQFKYEDFIRSPASFVMQFEEVFGLEATEITKHHLDSIKSHGLSQYPSICKDVEEPERDKFVSLMTRLGYLV
jgi:hypothetical protein